jgi:hypothetical protein
MGKAKNALMRVKKSATAMVSKEGIGKTGHEMLEYGAAAVLGLASKKLDQLGPIPVKPDIAGAGAGFLLMLSGGKRRKLGRTLLKGALHATLGRAIWSEEGLTVIQGIDGKVSVQRGTKAAAPVVNNYTAKVNIDAGAIDDEEDSDEEAASFPVG